MWACARLGHKDPRLLLRLQVCVFVCVWEAGGGGGEGNDILQVSALIVCITAAVFHSCYFVHCCFSADVRRDSCPSGRASLSRWHPGVWLLTLAWPGLAGPRLVWCGRSASRTVH